jgi:hypothetical protein
MTLFRSEEHITRWLSGRPRGVTLDVLKLSELAHAWWGDRLNPDWTPRSRDENQAILDGLGLTGDAWRLPSAS